MTYHVGMDCYQIPLAMLAEYSELGSLQFIISAQVANEFSVLLLSELPMYSVHMSRKVTHAGDVQLR